MQADFEKDSFRKVNLDGVVKVIEARQASLKALTLLNLAEEWARSLAKTGSPPIVYTLPSLQTLSYTQWQTAVNKF